jgi:folate-dependent tRNA-U54 methylase TrmFO/GidA
MHNHFVKMREHFLHSMHQNENLVKLICLNSFKSYVKISDTTFFADNNKVNTISLS